MTKEPELKPGTPLPWRLEQGTDLIWGACNPDDQTTRGMGYPIVEGHPGSSWQIDRKPQYDEREQNAAYIVTACNAYPTLLARIAELEGALEPFAKAADVRLCAGDDYWTDSKPIQGTDVAFHVTFGDLRAARALINRPSQ